MATRTATALFQSYDRAADAVTRLEAAGIPHVDISIVSNDQAHQGQHAGHPGTGTGASQSSVTSFFDSRAISALAIRLSRRPNS